MDVRVALPDLIDFGSSQTVMGRLVRSHSMEFIHNLFPVSALLCLKGNIWTERRRGVFHSKKIKPDQYWV